MQPGETVTLSVNLVSATYVNYALVGDPVPTQILAGPTSTPGNDLRFTQPITATTNVGVGFWIFATDGSVSVKVTCGKFDGPTLPTSRNLVLIVGDIGVSVTPSSDSAATGAILRKCQTVFLTEEKDGYGKVFFMGGYIPSFAYVDVAENYGQKGGQAIDPACVGK
ncbi:MAG: hypothetical protein OHK0023_20760 [Anaerolineae bacterium]